MKDSFEEKTLRSLSQLIEDKQRRVHKHLNVMIFIVFTLLVISTFYLFLLLNGNFQEGTYINKKEVQESLSKVIHNGGSLDEIKRVYSTKKAENKLFIFNKDEYLDSHYRSDISLSAILSDLLVNYYKQDSIVTDSTYVMRLRNMISTYETIHPFDGLEENQRYYLENIRLKLDSNYYFIQDDLVKLGDELDRKNLLVTKYLNKSETSFWISVIALVITFILSAYQIYQGSCSKKQMDKFMAEHSKRDDQMTT